MPSEMRCHRDKIKLQSRNLHNGTQTTNLSLHSCTPSAPKLQNHANVQILTASYQYYNKVQLLKIFPISQFPISHAQAVIGLTVNWVILAAR